MTDSASRDEKAEPQRTKESLTGSAHTEDTSHMTTVAQADPKRAVVKPDK